MRDKKNTLIRLNANENFYGCSPKVLRAIRSNIKNVYSYPIATNHLEEKLAEKLGVEQQNIVVGAGSVRLIDGIIQTFTKPDDEVVIFERSFVAYAQLAAAHRRKHLLVKHTVYATDLESIYPVINQKTKLIFIANPNNPTGTIITDHQLENFLKNISEQILVVIDEAYCEYTSDKSFPDSISLQKRFPNLIILRTFSKIYGLAGLRIGYGIVDSKISDLLKKSRIPFFFNSLSEDAAIAALEDEEFIASCAIKNDQQRDFLYKNLTNIGFDVVPSFGNFLYLNFESEQEKENTFKNFLDENLLICNLKVFGQDKSLRITIGDKEASGRLIQAVRLTRNYC